MAEDTDEDEQGDPGGDEEQAGEASAGEPVQNEAEAEGEGEENQWREDPAYELMDRDRGLADRVGRNRYQLPPAGFAGQRRRPDAIGAAVMRKE